MLSKIDATLSCVRLFGLVALVSVNSIFVIHAEWSVQVQPVPPSERPEGFYTYAVDLSCPNSNMTAWLAERVDMTPFVDGCGGFGDRVPSEFPNADASANRQNGMVAAGVFWGLVGLVIISLIGFGGINGDCCSYPGWIRTGSYPLALGMVIWLNAWFQIAAAEFGGRPDMWMCRPYKASFNAFGDLTDLMVETDDSVRDSSVFHNPSDWNQCQELATLCNGLTLHDETNNRYFSVTLKPNDEVATYLADKRQTVWSNAWKLAVIWVVLYVLMIPPRCSNHSNSSVGQAAPLPGVGVGTTHGCRPDSNLSVDSKIHPESVTSAIRDVDIVVVQTYQNENGQHSNGLPNPNSPPPPYVPQQ